MQTVYESTAISWSAQGNCWECPKCSVAVPQAFQVQISSNGKLIAESPRARTWVQPLSAVLALEQVIPLLEAGARTQYPGIRFGAPRSLTSDGTWVIVKDAYIKGQVVTVGQFIKGSNQVAVMTVIKADDNAANGLVCQLLDSLTLK